MRKTKIVTIDAEGRDKGKSFLIVEKDAWAAEEWSTRAIMALANVGVEVPDGAIQAGALGLFAIGLEALRKLPFDAAKPLLDEMMTCVSFVPDAGKVDPVTQRPATRPVIMPSELSDGDIEEVTTLYKLRQEALDLHLGFSVAAILSDLMAALRSMSQQNTQTSPEAAGQSSNPEKPLSETSSTTTA